MELILHNTALLGIYTYAPMNRGMFNTQMFAMAQAPPGVIEVSGWRYRVSEVFKHDFWAATALYEALDPKAGFQKIIVKFARSQGFCGLPLEWIGPLMRAHECAIYAALAGVAGVPQWVGMVGRFGYAIEYIDGMPLDQVPAPPAGFFDDLRNVFEAIHARGVAYSDANKLSNILVGPAGRPFLVDYQLAFHRRDEWPWPVRQILAACVRYVCQRDMYHLYKHKRRISPQELTEQELEISRNRGWLHMLHRKIAKPYRSIRRRFLRSRYEKGQLESPTASLERRCQPEKDTWRKMPQDS